MTGKMNWYWRAGIVCLINVAGIALLTEAFWRFSRGDPFMWRQVCPGPAVFQFRGMGIVLGLIAIGVPTMTGLAADRILAGRRCRASSSEAVRCVWHALGFWRHGWWWRGSAASVVVLAVALLCAAYWSGDPIARRIGTALHSRIATQTGTLTTATTVTPPQSTLGYTIPSVGAGSLPAQLADPALAPVLAQFLAPVQNTPGFTAAAVPTPTPAEVWIRRAHDVLTMIAGAVLALVVFRLLSLRAGPTDGYLHCLQCDYILNGLSEPRCPECGKHI
ncbi:MAG: hypothetical protein GY778_10945 [bacterium]|nr:hypothetical protein [bacterium]